MTVHTRKIIYACNFLITQIDFKHRLCTRSGCRDQQNGTVCVAEDSKKTQLEWAEKTGAETDFWLYCIKKKIRKQGSVLTTPHNCFKELTHSSSRKSWKTSELRYGKAAAWTQQLKS